MSVVEITPPPLSSQSLADLLCTIILLCRGHHENGDPFWAYMAVKPSMARTFQEARSQGPVNLDEYGTIIEMGEGDDIPPQVREHMERDFGISHDYESQLLRLMDVRDTV